MTSYECEVCGECKPESCLEQCGQCYDVVCRTTCSRHCGHCSKWICFEHQVLPCMLKTDSGKKVSFLLCYDCTFA